MVHLLRCASQTSNVKHRAAIRHRGVEFLWSQCSHQASTTRDSWRIVGLLATDLDVLCCILMTMLLRLNETADDVAYGTSGGTRMQLVKTSTGQWMTWRAAWTASSLTVRLSSLLFHSDARKRRRDGPELLPGTSEPRYLPAPIQASESMASALTSVRRFRLEMTGPSCHVPNLTVGNCGAIFSVVIACSICLGTLICSPPGQGTGLRGRLRWKAPVPARCQLQRY